MPKAKHKTLTLKVRIDPELLREVDLVAADLGFTRSKLVTRGLERVVQKWKERKLEIPSQRNVQHQPIPLLVRTLTAENLRELSLSGDSITMTGSSLEKTKKTGSVCPRVVMIASSSQLGSLTSHTCVCVVRPRGGCPAQGASLARLFSRVPQQVSPAPADLAGGEHADRRVTVLAQLLW